MARLEELGGERGPTVRDKYNDCARDKFEFGRKVYFMQSWYSCTWMSQSSTCTTTCS